MPKTKTNIAAQIAQSHKSPQEVADELTKDKEELIDQECAKEIEAVLIKHGRALQPYLQRSEFGDTARVRLARQEAPKDAKEEIVA